MQAWLDTHAGKYQIEPVYSLRQVYFDPARHGDNLDAVIATARRDLAVGQAEAREEVERDFTHARLSQANAAFYEKLRAKYVVRIEAADGAAADPAG